MTFPEAAPLLRYWMKAPPEHLLIRRVAIELGIPIGPLVEGPPSPVQAPTAPSRVSSPEEVHEMVSSIASAWR